MRPGRRIGAYALASLSKAISDPRSAGTAAAGAGRGPRAEWWQGRCLRKELPVPARSRAADSADGRVRAQYKAARIRELITGLAGTRRESYIPPPRAEQPDIDDIISNDMYFSVL